jgi:hypothetical protein
VRRAAHQVMPSVRTMKAKKKPTATRFIGL